MPDIPFVTFARIAGPVPVRVEFIELAVGEEVDRGVVGILMIVGDDDEASESIRVGLGRVEVFPEVVAELGDREEVGRVGVADKVWTVAGLEDNDVRLLKLDASLLLTRVDNDLLAPMRC